MTEAYYNWSDWPDDEIEKIITLTIGESFISDGYLITRLEDVGTGIQYLIEKSVYKVYA